MQREEEFQRWLDDPVTRLVFAALRAAQDAQKAAWTAASWDGGQVRGEALTTLLSELRVRADCYGALAEMTFADVAAWLGIEDAE